MITFCDHFLACVVGKVEWKRKVTKNLVKEIATNSDEGFALLVLENIWDEWSKIDAKEFFFAKHKNKNKKLAILSVISLSPKYAKKTHTGSVDVRCEVCICRIREGEDCPWSAFESFLAH